MKCEQNKLGSNDKTQVSATFTYKLQTNTSNGIHCIVLYIRQIERQHQKRPSPPKKMQLHEKGSMFWSPKKLTICISWPSCIKIKLSQTKDSDSEKWSMQL